MSRRRKVIALAAAVIVAAVACVRVVAIFGPQEPALPAGLRPPTPTPLDRVIPEVRVDAMELSDLLDTVGRLAGVEIVVDWDGIRQGASDPPISSRMRVNIELRLRDVTLAQVLAKVFVSLDQGDSLVALPAGDGGVRIVHFSAAGGPADAPVARYYDVRMLLREMDLEPLSGDEFTGCFGPAPPSPRLSGEEQLISLVMDCIHPESWSAHGGTVGDCDVFAGRLVVIQTPENHRQIERLLAQLRDPWPEDP